MKLSYGAAILGLVNAALAAEGGGPSESLLNTCVEVHGVLMALAFVAFFPLGAFTIRIFKFNGRIWLHAGAQLFAYATAIAGFGIGIWLARNMDLVGNHHAVIGFVVIGLLFFQPAAGVLHHRFFKRDKKRNIFSYGHIWLGRCVIILGIINGGLGLQLAGGSTGGKIAYGVASGVIFLLYLGVLGWNWKQEFKATIDNVVKDSKRSVV